MNKEFCLKVTSSPLDPAEGFFALGMYEDAWDELEALPPEQRAELPVLKLRLGILNALERYESAADLGASLISKGISDGDVYLAAAWAIRRAHGLDKAEALLLSAEPVLGGSALFHYNLACYACVAGRMDEAKERLEWAFGIDKSFRSLAIEDDDLQALWNSL